MWVFPHSENTILTIRMSRDDCEIVVPEEVGLGITNTDFENSNQSFFVKKVCRMVENIERLLRISIV